MQVLKIPVPVTHGHPFPTHCGFYPRIPADTDFFDIPSCVELERNSTKLIMTKIQPSLTLSKFSGDGPSQILAELNLTKIRPSRPKVKLGRDDPNRNSTELAPTEIRPSWPRIKFNRVGPYQNSTESNLVEI